jgi:hypothetical protein
VKPGALPVGEAAVGIEHVAPGALGDPLVELVVLAGELADAHEQKLPAAKQGAAPAMDRGRTRRVTEEVGHVQSVVEQRA